MKNTENRVPRPQGAVPPTRRGDPNARQARDPRYREPRRENAPRAEDERARAQRARAEDERVRAQRAREYAAKRERRRKAKWLLIIALLCLSCVLIYIISRFIGSFFVVGEIRLEGDSPYSAEEIIAASGISYGDKLYKTDKKAAVKGISEGLPYIRDVSVKIKLPSYVYITVTSEQAVIYTAISGGYYSVSSSMKVLERSDSPDKFISAGLVYTELPEVGSAVVGRKLTLADGTDPEYIGKFIDTLLESELKGRISKLFLDERFNIVMSVDQRFRVKFGSDADAAAKAFAASHVMAKQNYLPEETAVIDVSDPSAVIAVRREGMDLSKKSE